MRILLLAQWYSPVIGGEENHVRALAASLAARGHAVSVATLAQGGAPPSVELDGQVRVHRIRATAQRLAGLFDDPGRQSAPPLPDPEATLAIAQVLRAERPDVVHAHNWLLHAYLPLHPASGARLVVTLHDYSLICARKDLVLAGVNCDGPGPVKCLRCASDHYGRLKGPATVAGLWAMQPIERLAVDRFIAVSSAVAAGNRLVASGLPHEVIPNFIPDDAAPPTELESQLAAAVPDEPYLLFVGSFARSKGVHVLLQAYARLQQPPPLVLIGYRTAEQLPELADLPPGVSIHVDWPHGAVLEAWRRSMLGIVPSTWRDPCPTVALEAMAAGKPVVAARIGGLPDMVADGQSGLLVEPGDPASLAGALRSLIQDGGRRDTMGRAGAERVNAFRASTVVPRIEAVYARLQ